MTPKPIDANRWRLILYFFVVAWLLPALACNYPGLKNKKQTIKSTSTPAANYTTSSPNITPSIKPMPFQTPAESPTSTSISPGAAPTAGIGSSNFNYTVQSGDTLAAVARHFKVEPAQITSPNPIFPTGYLTPGQPLSIPVNLENVPNTPMIFPDSEVIFSPTASDFDIAGFIASQGGFLSTYAEPVYGQNMSSAAIIHRVAQESSINPRLLLAFLEFRSGWVSGQLRSPEDLKSPLGFNVPGYPGLYQELVMATTHLNIGYYGWRTGQFDSFRYTDGQTGPVNPWLNSGSVALQNLFAKFYKPQAWLDALYGNNNFLDLYREYFGDPWSRAASVELMFLPGMTQPSLELPFAPGERWSLTGGPHAAWNSTNPRGALDFAPVTGEPVCSTSRAWVTASGNGVIVRSENSVVALDLDGDGNEQTGWVVVYLHIAATGRAPAGQQVVTGDPIGHPSCERGQSTGTHVHIARKYDGEWLEADGPLPFILSGWQTKAGKLNYQGSLSKGDRVVIASPLGPGTSIIVR